MYIGHVLKVYVFGKRTKMSHCPCAMCPYRLNKHIAQGRATISSAFALSTVLHFYTDTRVTEKAIFTQLSFLDVLAYMCLCLYLHIWLHVL